MITKFAICYIVFNGAPHILEHEHAHCWGWEHTTPVATSTIHQHPRPPRKFRKPYPNVIIYQRNGKEVGILCGKLNKSDWSSPYLSTAKGCAIGGLE